MLFVYFAKLSLTLRIVFFYHFAQIPENFRTVSENTLREFYRALQQNKDTEQSWKKAIYKVIARLDDNVPEYFKNPNFMEQLE